MLTEKAKQYAEEVISGKEIATFEVKTQCEWFLEDLEKQNNEDFRYYYNEDFIIGIEELLKLFNFATGLDDVTEKTLYEGLVPFQCFFIANIFGWKFKNEPFRYRYRQVDLFIPRKNGKSFLAGLIILLLMLTEDNYSEFYSICLDRSLAGEIKKAISQLIDVSPAINQYFKVPKTLLGNVTCSITKSTFQPRTSEANRNNSVRVCAFIADEFGAMKDKKNYNAMRSGQRNVKNALSFILTTAYAEDKSPMLEELDYLRKIYKKLEFDDRLFALVYYATEDHLWDDYGIYMSNPLRIEQNYEEIRDARKNAISKSSEREEYLTKSMNHFVPSNKGETYIDIEKLRKCKIKDFDWTGKDVYLGIDLALTRDNCSCSMVCYENEKIYAKSWAFIPEGRIEDKNREERTNYNKFIEDGDCFACGDEIVSYNFIENFIMNIQEKYGVNIVQIGYDRANCMSTVGKLENAGYETVEVGQRPIILHPATKLLFEYITEKKFAYTKNLLYEVNFQNAKCTGKSDNENMFVSKKKSNGKVDMVVSTIIAIHLLQQELLFGDDDFVVQVG